MPNLNEPYSILDLMYLAFGFALLGGYVYAVHKWTTSYHRAIRTSPST
jgi:hypothetical protein